MRNALPTRIRNIDGSVGHHNIPANDQHVRYSPNYVYVKSKGIPAYAIGPWPGTPNIRINQNFVFRIACTVGTAHAGQVHRRIVVSQLCTRCIIHGCGRKQIPTEQYPFDNRKDMPVVGLFEVERRPPETIGG